MDFERRVILASGSPRRRDLLREIVSEFDVVISDFCEDLLEGEMPWQTAERLAQSKAKKVYADQPDAIVIGGDTVVAFEDEGWVQLGKPESLSEAQSMLRILSGRSHAVYTGLCVTSNYAETTTHDCTWVTFRELSDQEIHEYLVTGESMDKAGAYACQGGAAKFIVTMDGSLSNVIGLPLEKLREVLRSFSKTKPISDEIGDGSVI